MSDSSSEDLGGGRSAPLSDAQLWSILTEELCIRVMVVSLEGRVLFANSQLIHRYGGGDASALDGARLGSFLRDGLAEELLALIGQCYAEDRTIQFEGVVQGRHCLGTVIPLRDAVRGEPAALVVSRDSFVQEDPESVSRVQLKTCELGELAVLTPRELEILGLIGEGLTSQQIADRLNRSVKTVEWHRVSIGQKLRVRSRVGLARMAIGAGLSGFGRGEPTDDGVATAN